MTGDSSARGRGEF